jgi:CrcB protein
MILLWIGLGGAVGSILRYVIGGAVQRLSARGFPVGTLFVNVLGCIIIGVLLQRFMNEEPSGATRAALVVGFCGGFTTFSTFSAETIGLIQGGQLGSAFAYALLSVTLCLGATWGGMVITRAIGA